MSADENNKISKNNAADVSRELDNLLTLVDERCNGKASRIKRENLETVENDGSRNNLIRYTEYDENGMQISDVYYTENQFNTAIEKLSEKKQAAVAKSNSAKSKTSPSAKVQQKSVKPVSKSSSAKDNDESTEKKKERKAKADTFFRSFFFVIVPITLILTVMLAGQNYIKTHSDERIRLLSIETIPLDDEETTQKTVININTANSAELTYLPGIGEAKAKKIIEYREKNGEFDSIEELLNVNGIGESTFENIKPYVTVGK